MDDDTIIIALIFLILEEEVADTYIHTYIQNWPLQPFS